MIRPLRFRVKLPCSKTFIKPLFFPVQVWDQGRSPCGGERPGEPEGQSRLPKLQATPLQHAGILWSHRSRPQGNDVVLSLPRHRVQSRGLHGGEWRDFILRREETGLSVSLETKSVLLHWSLWWFYYFIFYFNLIYIWKNITAFTTLYFNILS